MTWRLRLADEKTALDDKLAKLLSFIASAQFGALPREDQILLQRQSGVMAEYSIILRDRLARAKE